jgi:hypothetical protein
MAAGCRQSVGVLGPTRALDGMIAAVERSQ